MTKRSGSNTRSRAISRPVRLTEALGKKVHPLTDDRGRCRKNFLSTASVCRGQGVCGGADSYNEVSSVSVIQAYGRLTSRRENCRKQTVWEQFGDRKIDQLKYIRDGFRVGSYRF